MNKLKRYGPRSFVRTHLVVDFFSNISVFFLSFKVMVVVMTFTSKIHTVHLIFLVEIDRSNVTFLGDVKCYHFIDCYFDCFMVGPLHKVVTTLIALIPWTSLIIIVWFKTRTIFLVIPLDFASGVVTSFNYFSHLAIVLFNFKKYTAIWYL